MRGIRRVKERVPMDECKRRALAAFTVGSMRFVKASTVAEKIWPGATFKPQGAGAAASRILRLLAQDGYVRWQCAPDRSNWGWELVDRD